MVRVPASLLLGSCVAGVFATSSTSEPRVALEPAIETFRSTPQWGRIGRAAPSDLVHPVFMLKHQAAAMAAFEDAFWDISTPGAPGYGKHLTRTEVDARLPPMDGARDAVLAFLQEHGMKPSSEAADMIEAEMPAAVAERLFQTEFHRFKHGTAGIELIRATSAYTVPASVGRHLYVVGDLAHLPAIDSPRLAQAVEKEQPANWPNDCTGCKNLVTPAVLQQAYNLGEIPSGQNTTMAVAEFQGISWDTGDLDHFRKQCQLETPVKVDHQTGMNLPMCRVPFVGSELCMEALLDIEYIKAVGGDIPLTSISALRYSLLHWAQQLSKMEHPPLVHSVSYGNDEAQQTSVQYMVSVNAQFMKLGARGLSLLFASGDQGVYGRSGPTEEGRFKPDFPASSPYVTAVGGTDFSETSVIGPEKVWYAGGGGFSDTFPVPAYQQSAVAGYLKAAAAKGVLPAKTSFNATGRAYPDIAALAGEQNAYCVAASTFGISTMTGVAGTSAACPVVAGIFARINALRSDQGMTPMGFLNPFIYQHGRIFNDVTIGRNDAGGMESFRALAGWDPATGFGTPNFEKLRVAALQAGVPAGVLVV